LSSAESLYEGEPLLDWKYEPWAEPIRERIAQTHEALLNELGKCLLEAGDGRGAAERCLSLVDSDPLCEQWHRGAMRAYVAAGELALALRRFRSRLRPGGSELPSRRGLTRSVRPTSSRPCGGLSTDQSTPWRARRSSLVALR